MAFSLFFAFGALMSGLAGFTLLVPGTFLEPMWLINPENRIALASMGASGIVLMGVVSLLCGLAATGLWRRRQWARLLAIAILCVNVIADLGNALFRDDLRTLIGVPIASAMIWLLWRGNARGRSDRRK